MPRGLVLISGPVLPLKIFGKIKFHCDTALDAELTEVSAVLMAGWMDSLAQAQHICVSSHRFVHCVSTRRPLAPNVGAFQYFAVSLNASIHPSVLLGVSQQCEPLHHYH